MKIWHLCTVVLVSLAIGNSAWSQSQNETPKPPFIGAVPAGSLWTVLITPGESPSLTPGRSQVLPAKLEMVVGKNSIQRGTITYRDGTYDVFYAKDGTVYQQVKQSSDVVAMSPENLMQDAWDGLRVTGFPGVSWLSSKAFVGIELLDKVPCYKFQDKFEDAEVIPLTAWIRVADRHPVRVQIGNWLYEFSSISPFEQNVDVPEFVQKKMLRSQSQNDALRRILSGNAR